MNRILTALLIFNLQFVIACKLGPDGKRHLDPAIMASSAEKACRFGAAFDLGRHPEHRPLFEEARRAVGLLLATGNFDHAALAKALQDLPLDGIEGEVGMMVIDGVLALWDDYGRRLLDLDAHKSYETYVRPIAEAIARGLDRGMGPNT